MNAKELYESRKGLEQIEMIKSLITFLREEVRSKSKEAKESSDEKERERIVDSVRDLYEEADGVALLWNRDHPNDNPITGLWTYLYFKGIEEESNRNSTLFNIHRIFIEDLFEKQRYSSKVTTPLNISNLWESFECNKGFRNFQLLVFYLIDRMAEEIVSQPATLLDTVLGYLEIGEEISKKWSAENKYLPLKRGWFEEVIELIDSELGGAVLRVKNSMTSFLGEMLKDMFGGEEIEEITKLLNQEKSKIKEKPCSCSCRR